MPHGGAELAINGRFLRQPTTGVQRVAREVTREIDALVSEGYQDINVRLLCQTGADTSDLDLKSTKVEEVEGPGGYLWEQTALPLAVGEATLLCLGNTAPIYSLLRGKAVALMIHDLSYRIYPNAYRLSYRAAHALVMPILLRKADPIITVSQSERKMLAALLPESMAKVTVAQNGGWRDQGPGGAADSTCLTGTRRYALYVGSLSQRKNIDGLIKVAIRLATDDDMDFMFVGSLGSILSPTHFNIPDAVRPHLRFLGQIEDLDVLAAIYRNASCLVFPSFYEASPLPPLEAMHFDCPVVASSIPSMRERCGDAAEYCDPSDPSDILAAVRRVLYQPGLRDRLVISGRAQASHFSWREQAKRILAAVAATRQRA
jgi:glycosyltransferase involved in cell wall biosynthesis